ncbi:hypothetical protein KR215_009686, partial [Drosophila sulfurigaster]
RMSLQVLAREGLNCAIIMGAGDVIAQLAIEKKSYKDYNAGRTARFASIGLCFCGPVLRKWYMTLDDLVVKEQPSLQRAVKKMLIDQACFSPIFTLTLTYLVPFVNGEMHRDIVKRIKECYLMIMARSYLLWPMAQVINFALIPINFQVIYVQFIALIWNCYLSLVLNK